MLKEESSGCVLGVAKALNDSVGFKTNHRLASLQNHAGSIDTGLCTVLKIFNIIY